VEFIDDAGHGKGRQQVVLGVRPHPGDREPKGCISVIRWCLGNSLWHSCEDARARKDGVIPNGRDTEETTGH
jgi:hypothetical protein